MAERPILFSGPLVRAILDGTKTQTRRVVTKSTTEMGCGVFADVDLSHALVNKPSPFFMGGEYLQAPVRDDEPEQRWFRCYPRWSKGDRLWVRETHALIWPFDGPPMDARDHEVEYRADGDPARAPGQWPDDERRHPDAPRWRPSIFMPRWASRITLEVTEVRVERVQDISEQDARAEGADVSAPTWSSEHRIGWAEGHCRDVFRSLWDDINKGRGFGWDDNPWVWAISFRRSS